MKLIAIGDVHGDWGVFNEILEEIHWKYHNQQVIILQCGDFGIWPRFVNFHSKLSIPENMEIHFCPGNHEDWQYLEQFGYRTTQLMQGLFYHPFGSLLEVTFNGFDSDIGKKTIMFCGGADSYDKNQRTAFKNWFPQERITAEDMRHLPETEVDIIISHTGPSDVVKKCLKKK